MKRNAILIFLILMVSVLSFGQVAQEKLFDTSLLIEDYDYLLKSLEETHPNLYAYIPESEFNLKTDEFRASINKPMSRTEFYKIVLKTIALIKQGHSMIFDDSGFGKHMNEGGLRFPFEIFYENGHIYIDENYSSNKELLKGTEIIAINQIPVSKITENFRPYLRVRPNGFIDKTLAHNWASLLWLEYNFGDEFVLTYMSQGDYTIKTIKVAGINKETLDQNRVKSDDLKFHFTMDENKSIAIIQLNTFRWNFEEYDSLLKDSFNKIKAHGINNLIIDLRKNGGGNGSLANALMNYLTDQTFVSQAMSQVKTSEATKICYTTHPVFVDAIEQARKAEENSSEFLELVDCFLEKPAGTITTFDKTEITPKHKDNRFDGHLYVLTSKRTFSAATYFTAMIKDNKLGCIVGEETSDNPSDYGCFMWFELPNTKLTIQNSTKYDERPAGYDDQRGVIPDFEVNQTYNDYLIGYDRIMNYTYWLIEAGITHKTH